MIWGFREIWHYLRQFKRVSDSWDTDYFECVPHPRILSYLRSVSYLGALAILGTAHPGSERYSANANDSKGAKPHKSIHCCKLLIN